MDREYAARLAEVAGLYLKMGTIGFGGPAATIAMMEDEVVHRRRWLTHADFLDLLGATNLIPGPNSTEMAIHIGLRRAGWPGLIVAGICFILPAAVMVGVLAWGYVRFGKLPQAAGFLYGVKPVVLAIVLQAIWRLGRTTVKTKLLVVLGIFAAILGACGVNELAILFGAGFAMAGRHLSVTGKGRQAATLSGFLPGLPAVAAGTTTGAAAAAAFGLWPIFLFFLKIGSVLFGSGYVLIVFLRADLVDRWHWLTESQLLDAIAVGQITPGPVFTTATFIGYLLSGASGAVLATVGIFLPAFIFVALSGPVVSRLRRSPASGAFLDGLNAASLALMAVVVVQLAGSAFVDILTIAMGAASTFLLLRYRLNSTWLVLGGTVIGILLSFRSII